jgi:ADP-ribose pyrophosphatase YjhB (NUDIX family)
MKFIWHRDTNFQHLYPITQVYGVCFDKIGNILIIKESNKEWNIPGGKPELGETPESTLKRELDEEVDVSIVQNGMIGYFEVISDEPTIYQLRYAAIIDQINPQTVDPATNKINERKFIKPNEFFDYVKIKDYRPIIDEATEWFKKNKNII